MFRTGRALVRPHRRAHRPAYGRQAEKTDSGQPDLHGHRPARRQPASAPAPAPEARDLIEQSAGAGDLRQLSYRRGRGDWADSLAESTELTQAELDLLHSQVPGHRWNGWCRLTGDEDYYAACCCGWRSTDTGDVSPMLGQVRDHLDAVRQSRGGSPSARARDESGSDVGRGEIVHLHERSRELCATAAGGQIRLSRSASHSADLPWLLHPVWAWAHRVLAPIRASQAASRPASAAWPRKPM